jgi:nitrogenase molybdenum-iron protein NifN
MKERNFVDVNKNPCNMCMPMGSSMALKGIEGSIMLLHGSQGCSTYIRRHIARHFHEPMDIASSSLNEKGTVYGGAKNLVQGLKNVIKIYQPKVIGVSTTCLAETIGEDIDRIIADFVEEEKIEDVVFVTADTPGYGATHHEGYYYFLRNLVEQLVEQAESHNKINIILNNTSPASIREIKKIVLAFNIEATYLPDISETMDGGFQREFKRIPDGGTKLEDIKKMSGAVATIEIGALLNEKYSPGKYLEANFGVPFYKLPMPIGIENTDLFINTLKDITKQEAPQVLKDERKRMVDAMIDSHKYNREGRAAIFGDPETVYGLTRLCLENGIKPVVVATGSESAKLREYLEKDIENLTDDYVILRDTDFETIQHYVREKDVNVLIGHSDGKFVEEKEGVPLIRVGFPIHDRIGGQRINYTGYEGSTTFMDSITNTLLEKKYSTFRKRMYDSFYVPLAEAKG